MIELMDTHKDAIKELLWYPSKISTTVTQTKANLVEWNKTAFAEREIVPPDLQLFPQQPITKKHLEEYAAHPNLQRHTCKQTTKRMCRNGRKFCPN